MKPGIRGKPANVEPQTANANAMPVLDESVFQQVLEAAFVIQEQNDVQPATRPSLDPAATLSEIAETQELLRSQTYDLRAAADLIAQRLEKITHATGIAIAVIRADVLEFCAGTGSAAELAGSSAPIGAELADFLREEEVLRRFQNNVQLSAELLRNQNPEAPIFFPVYHDARIAGLLQLSFAETEPIQAHEIRSCQLMAGLMGEAISRATELEWRQELAAERATMLEALERLRPQLERLAAEPHKTASGPARETDTASAAEMQEMAEVPGINFADEMTLPEPSAVPAQLAQETEELSDAPFFSEALSTPINITEAEPALNAVCERCGNHFGEGEMFCGRCGAARSTEMAVPHNLETEERQPGDEDFDKLPANGEAPFPPELEEIFSQFSTDKLPDREPSNQPPAADQNRSALTLHRVETAPESTVEVPEVRAENVAEGANLAIVADSAKPKPSPWDSASRARKWLESLEQANSPERIWLARHRADLWVGVSVIVLLLALSGWGTRPAQLQMKTPPQPSLTLFERMLVSLGLAEAPPPPAYLGNPNVQVWVDVHTALYYCPGSDLYGKTPGGKLTTQRDAQLDSFEPAARKSCE